MDTTACTQRSVAVAVGATTVDVEAEVADCLRLLGIDAEPERERCRLALLALTRPGMAAAGALCEWFAAALGETEGALSLAEARAAFMLAGGARRWERDLLSAQPAPALCEALRRHRPRAVPDESPASMPMQSLSWWTGTVLDRCPAGPSLASSRSAGRSE